MKRNMLLNTKRQPVNRNYNDLKLYYIIWTKINYNLIKTHTYIFYS